MSTPAHDMAFASQAAFRALMECLSRPGETRALDGVGAPAPMQAATAALVRSIADYESPIWLDPAFTAALAVADWIRFHTGAPIVATPDKAAFALIADASALPAFMTFAQGSEEYPDRSTTIIVQVDRFSGPTLTLQGPGIATTRDFSATPLSADFARRLRDNRDMYPRGVDLVFVAGHEIAALPRSVRVVES